MSAALERELALAAVGLAAVSAAHAPVLAFTASAVGAPVAPIFAASLAISLVAAATLRLAPAVRDVVVAVALIGQAALFTAIFAGHQWQADTHMYFFALIAAISVLASPRALVAAAAVVALHHLLLNALMPALVYPGGSDLSRTGMHAAIVLIETGVLFLMVRHRLALQAQADAEAARAQADAARAQDAEAAARDSESRNAAMRESLLREVDAEFAAMVDAGLDGDLGRRITRRFDDAVLEALKERMNAFFGGLDAMLSEIDAGMEALARGDLFHEAADPRRGRFETLRLRMNATTGSLRDLVGGISEAAEAARAAARDIGSDADELVRRTEETAGALEQTAATMEQISQTTRMTGETIGGMRGAAEALAERSRAGACRSAEAVVAVEAIERQSARIAEIVSVIDAIAFQTNLLALNASVEAARAGEAGKGFAVVAGEVQSLARRTAEAAADIRELIGSSEKSVRSGARLVQDTGAALGAIADAVEDFTRNVGDIARAAVEQTAGILEVNAAVTQVERDTQANAAAAERSLAAVRALGDQVDRLDGLLAQFDVGPAAERFPAGTLAAFAHVPIPQPAPAPRETVSGGRGRRAVAGGARSVG